MASFFDLKARKEAAATNGTSSKAPPPKETTRLQPWVEK
jgi:replication factor C subunit 2/4